MNRWESSEICGKYYLYSELLVLNLNCCIRVSLDDVQNEILSTYFYIFLDKLIQAANSYIDSYVILNVRINMHLL